VATSRTTYGAIGVKAWIYKGKFGEEIQTPHRRRRRPPRRIGPAARGSGRAKAVPAQEAKNPPAPDVAAAPAEPKKTQPEDTKAS